jgi:hypothetical protein
MIWVLIAAFGSVAWLAVLLMFVALCRVAAGADALATSRDARAEASPVYLSRRDRRRSLRSFPSVWQVGQ